SRLLVKLSLPTPELAAGNLLLGLGGQSVSVVVEAVLILKSTEGQSATVKGQYLATTEATGLDMSILGRDVLSNFDLILSRRRKEVLLLAGKHAYSVTA